MRLRKAQLGHRVRLVGRGPLLNGPYWFLGGRPFREAEVRSYIIREHRRGRRIREILDDSYVVRYGNLRWKALGRADTIAALEADVREAIDACHPMSVASSQAVKSG